MQRQKDNVNRKISAQQAAQMAAMRANGMTQQAIADVFGVSRNAVRQRLDWRRPEPKPLRPCGTQAAYRRHQRYGERPCVKCCEANAQYVKMMKAKRSVAKKMTKV